MLSWDRMKLWRSAFRLHPVPPHELIAAGALLVCFAVVLNVSPFAKAPKRDAVAAIAEPVAGSPVVANSQVGAATQPERSQSNLQSNSGTGEVAERIRPLFVSSIPGDAFGRLGFQPPGPKDGETKAGLAPDPAAQPLASITGVWVPDAGACSARNLRDGLFPTIINSDGAWAGETFCIFKNQKPTETGWKVVAHCSNPREHWTTEVRLTVKDNRLTWASKRGTQIYTRCGPDFMMAAAR